MYFDGCNTKHSNWWSGWVTGENKMETRVGKMKSFFKIILISLCAGLIACSDKQEESQEQAQRHISSAKVYMEQGQYRAAIIEAKNIIQLTPDSADGYIALAHIYNEIGSYASVQSLLEQVVKKNPAVATELAYAYFLNKKSLTAINTVNTYPADASNPEAKQRQAWISAMSNISLGNKDGYELALKEFKALGGSDAEAKYIEASYLLSKGELENAQSALTEVLAATPDNIDALTMMAGVNIFLRNLDGAEKHLTKALGLLKNTDILSRRKGQIISLLTDTLIQQGRTSEAYTYQKLLAESNPEGNAAQQRFSEAMEYYQQGKFTEAEAILRELREQYPNDKNTATLLGMVEYQQGSNQQAADLFDEFIDPETATPSVLQAAALVKFRNNQMDEAIALLKKAADSQPNNHIVLATYGLALLDKDPQSAEGATALEKSLALEPKQQRIRIALAKRHLLLKQTEQAVAQLQKAYQEQPDDFYIQQAYFKTLLNDNQTDKLEEEITAFKNKDPQNSRGYFFAGWYQLQQKNYSAAEQEFEKAIAVKDSKEKQFAYAGLAQVYETQEMAQKAITAWQLALEEDPSMVIGYARWFAQMRKLKREESAFSFVRDLEGKTSKWEPSVVLAQLYVGKNQFSEAIKHIDIALERSNNATNIKQIAANLYRLQGVQLRGQNKLPEARESLMQAIKLFPENADYLAVLIETEIGAKNIQEAQKLLDQFVKTPENEAERLFLQGLIRFAEDKKDEGFQLYMQSWAAKPMEIVAEQIYGFHHKGGNQEKAEAFLADWYEKLPKSNRASLLLAVSAQGKNDPKQAIAWYEKSVELNPQMPAALNNLAWMYYESKDPRALEYAKRAYELAPNVAAIVDTYGWILVERGDLQKGIELLTKAVALEPDNQEMQYHLKEAQSRQ
jgi:cellulose synthase operon protein C